MQLRKNVLVGGLNPPEKYAQIKLDHETPGASRGENKKCLKPPPPSSSSCSELGRNLPESSKGLKFEPKNRPSGG